VVGSIAGVAGAGALIVGAGYLLHRMMNHAPAPTELSSDIEGAKSTATLDNALFQEAHVMQPNHLFEGAD
jgi:hypothetical protein